MPTYPLSPLRATVLHAQQLSGPPAKKRATAASITQLITALGYLQIDTLSVVHRAHYITLWSRLGAFDTTLLHNLLYIPGKRRLYEGWGHAASIIPLEHHRYHRWRNDHVYSYNPTFREWLSKPENRKLAAATLKRIRTEGPLRVGDFEYDGPEKGVWYDWKPHKLALEALFAHGDLMISDRPGFQRVYDLAERVLPTPAEKQHLPGPEARRFCLEHAAKALGVFEPSHLTLYAYMRSTPVRQEIATLLSDGTLVEIRGESVDGPRKWFIHRDNLPVLQRAADGGIPTPRTTFLSPFDSLFWSRGRDRKLWNFQQLLECYKPAPQRVYGYFCLPILYKDQLIGRFDPKLDRKTGVLHLLSLYLEPGVKPDDELISSVAETLRDFAAWHGAKEIRIGKSKPLEFGKRLAREI